MRFLKASAWLILITLISACKMSVDVKDLDTPTDAPVPTAMDPHIKLSPGSVQSTSTTFGMKAAITPTDQVLTGSSVRAKLSLQRRFR